MLNLFHGMVLDPRFKLEYFETQEISQLTIAKVKDIVTRAWLKYKPVTVERQAQIDPEDNALSSTTVLKLLRSQVSQNMRYFNVIYNSTIGFIVKY